MSIRVKRKTTSHLEFGTEKRALSTAVCAGLRVGGAAMVLSMSPMAMAQFGAVVEVSELDGSNGFAIRGIDEFDNAGFSVSGVGDFNDDGVADLIVGAAGADPNGVLSAGESYVVFGGTNVGSGGVIELSLIDGSNGFVINGIDQLSFSGASVSDAGDVNGDGVADLILSLIHI